MRTITKDVYMIDEHPNKSACFIWIRDNWYDLNQYSVDEVIESLKELQRKIGGELDFNISQVPDRGEFITLVGYDTKVLNKLNPEECPLTGVCWDYDMIEELQKEGTLHGVLKSLHNDTEHLYSDEGLYDLCVANEYEFYEDGEFYN